MKDFKRYNIISSKCTAGKTGKQCLTIMTKMREVVTEVKIMFAEGECKDIAQSLNKLKEKEMSDTGRRHFLHWINSLFRIQNHRDQVYESRSKALFFAAAASLATPSIFHNLFILFKVTAGAVKEAKGGIHPG